MMFIQSNAITTKKSHTAESRHWCQKVSSVTPRQPQERSKPQETLRARLQCKMMAVLLLAGS